jgi:hypothetical protein
VLFHLNHSASLFLCLVLFKIGSSKVFSQAGLKPSSSWSLPPEKLGLQAWTPVPGFWKSYFHFFTANLAHKLKDHLFLCLNNLIYLCKQVVVLWKLNSELCRRLSCNKRFCTNIYKI